jgi:hypothetical protein
VISPDRKGINFERFGAFDPKKRRHPNRAHGKSPLAMKIKIKKVRWSKNKSAAIIWYGNCLYKTGEGSNGLGILI